MIKARREAVVDGDVVQLYTKLLARAGVLSLAELGTGIAGEPLHVLARVDLARDAPCDATPLAGAVAAVR